MSDEAPAEIVERSRVETRVREFDADGAVIFETVTTVVRRGPEPDDSGVGMYL